MAEGLEEKTKEQLEKQGFKFASSKEYMWKLNEKGGFDFYKINEKTGMYSPTKVNTVLKAEEHQHPRMP